MTTSAMGEDGSKLWLRYARLSDAKRIETCRAAARQIVLRQRDSKTLAAAAEELRAALQSMLGASVPFAQEATADGAVVIGERESLGPQAFRIRSAKVNGRRTIVISSSTDIGALYGTFQLLRLMATGQSIEALDIEQSPRYARRILDHWDNLDGSIERGYAGHSLWKWDELPEKLDPRYTAYARAMASIGLNGAVLNNVNAKPQSLSPAYLKKTAALAEVFRPFGVRVYLSANFAAPKLLGNLPTADPRDPAVAAWWRAKADEIYRIIPDFGGFVVKANSEGQPGPQDYGRTHADGANVLADALAPHGGIVMWRAFVYDEKVDARDRAKRAYIEFTALDGKFRDNVMVQVKNGPIDFQPREPFHPLFGAMKRTPLVAELQVTQEYLGHSSHLVFLAPMWKEFLDADTFACGPGSSVAKQFAAIAAVANTGDDVNWCGHHFAQANWYAYGRLAWDPDLSAATIADEWLRMNFTDDDSALKILQPMMLDSWETFVSYSMPLGLHHLIAGDHYAPAPWNATEPRADWTATYYHQADGQGIGFNRTSRDGGSGAIAQYFPQVRDRFGDVHTCPESLLLWFHHVPWDFRLKSGRTLWEGLCARYGDGAEAAQRMERRWAQLAPFIDGQRHREVADKLAIQARDAVAWRDACLRYFQTFSGQRIR